MTNGDDSATRIRRLEDRNAIHDLVAMYSYICDERQVDELREAFTQDGVLRVANGLFRARGTDEIVAAMRLRWAPLGVSNHVVHGIVVRFDPIDPDAATGLVSSHVENVINGVPNLVAIRYKDAYRRDRGRWRFSERVLSYLYFLPTTVYVTGALAEPNLVHTGREPQAPDWPEVLQGQTDFGWLRPFFAEGGLPSVSHGEQR
jgi:hypothetical protein